MPVSPDCFAEERQMLLVEQRLTRRYSSVVSREAVRQVMRQHAAQFDGAPVRVFVALLVERAASLDLDIVARSRAA